MNALFRAVTFASLALFAVSCASLPSSQRPTTASSGAKNPVTGVTRPQALSAKKSVSPPTVAPNNVAKWEKDIADYEKADREQSPPKNGILFVGSSTFRLWKTLSEDFPGLPVINRGFGGSTFPDLNYYFNRLVPQHQPSVIVVYEGDNDIAKGHTTARVLANWQVFARKARAACPEAQILFVSVKPSLKREALLPAQRRANAAIKKDISGRKGMAYVDMVPDMLDSEGRPREELLGPDKLHMSPAGYALWTEKLKPLLAN